MGGFQLQCTCDRAVRMTEHALKHHGFEVTRSFDLCNALASLGVTYPCTHHQTGECTCNYIVLSVYVPAEPQRSRRILLHGHRGSTWLSLPAPAVDRRQAEESGVDPRLVHALADVLAETGRPLV